MDQLGAMRETLKLAKRNRWFTSKQGCTVEELEMMFFRAEAGGYSKARLGRELGWMQAIVYTYANLPFSLFEELNARFK